MMSPALEKALAMTEGIGRPECARFRAGIFSKYQKFCLVLAGAYAREAKARGYKAANTWLLKQSQALEIGTSGLVAGSTEQQLKDYAEIQAVDISKALAHAAEFDAAGAFFTLCDERCKAIGVVNPVDSVKYPEEKLCQFLRLEDPKWWFRKLRVINKRKMEQFARERGLVCKQKSIYCSNYGLGERLAQKTRNDNFMQDMIIENNEGFSMALADAVASSVSNPENRRNELMTRIAGFEHIAKALDYVGMFVTLTAPSAYHCVLSTGKRNSKYNNTTPKQVQEYLSEVWAKIRAQWARDGVRPFGFRVAEPHHDGTPHWHMLLFVPVADYDKADCVAAKYARESHSDEMTSEAARKARYYCKKLDLDIDSAAGYIAKYVSKNIDSFGVDFDYEDGNCAKSNAVRVDAWAATWGIRQFQQIGGASVTVWRELRKGISQGAIDLQQVSAVEFKAIADAANDGDWAAFVSAMGGVLVPRSKHALAAYMVLSDKRNDYNEFVSMVRGVLMRRTAQVIKTRLFEWVIKKAPPSGASWSCDNNCTQSESYFISGKTPVYDTGKYSHLGRRFAA